jgi:uncharacterized membrane protein
MTLHPLLSGLPTNLTVALPLALAYAVLSGDLMLPSATFFAVSITEAVIGSAYGVVSLRAQQHSDAGSFATLVKIHVVLVIVLSTILLGESLSMVQLFGSALVLGSGFILSGSISRRGLQYNIASIFLLAAVVVLGRYAVLLANVGTTLLFATIIGLIIKIVTKGHQVRSNMARLRIEYKTRAAMSLFQFLQVLTFVLAVDVSGNVSLVSSIATLKVMTVMIGSHVFLRERDNVKRKLVAGVLSILGVLLL